MGKKDHLKTTIRHINIKAIDATKIIEAMAGMSFSSRATAPVPA